MDEMPMLYIVCRTWPLVTNPVSGCALKHAFLEGWEGCRSTAWNYDMFALEERA